VIVDRFKLTKFKNAIEKIAKNMGKFFKRVNDYFLIKDIPFPVVDEADMARMQKENPVSTISVREYSDIGEIATFSCALDKILLNTPVADLSAFADDSSIADEDDDDGTIDDEGEDVLPIKSGDTPDFFVQTQSGENSQENQSDKAVETESDESDAEDVDSNFKVGNSQMKVM
jgi:hypothetical protein